MAPPSRTNWSAGTPRALDASSSSRRASALRAAGARSPSSLENTSRISRRDLASSAAAGAGRRAAGARAAKAGAGVTGPAFGGATAGTPGRGGMGVGAAGVGAAGGRAAAGAGRGGVQSSSKMDPAPAGAVPNASASAIVTATTPAFRASGRSHPRRLNGQEPVIRHLLKERRRPAVRGVPCGACRAVAAAPDGRSQSLDPACFPQPCTRVAKESARISGERPAAAGAGGAWPATGDEAAAAGLNKAWTCAGRDRPRSPFRSARRDGVLPLKSRQGTKAPTAATSGGRADLMRPRAVAV